MTKSYNGQIKDLRKQARALKDKMDMDVIEVKKPYLKELTALDKKICSLISSKKTESVHRRAAKDGEDSFFSSWEKTIKSL